MLKAPILRILALAGSLVLATQNIALGDNRVDWYGQQNPISTWLNLSQRDARIGQGARVWNYFGSNPGFSGTFANLQIAPAGSLNVNVAPVSTSFPGTVYGVIPDDSASYPATQPSGATGLSLPADATQLLIAATTTTATSSMGLTAGSSSSQSVDNLIECQPLTTDLTTTTINLINSSGGAAGTASVPRDRIDTVNCQSKASSSSTSPIVPSADANFVALGYVNVPFGTSTITTGMITQYAAFPGFALASTPGATGIDTSSNPQTKIGTFTDTGGLVFGNGTTGGSFSGGTGNGSVTGNLSFGSGGTGGTFYGSSGNSVITGVSQGNRFVATAPDASGMLTYTANNGANQTTIGENTGSGYPYFSVAKLTSGGTFQTWLLGVDSSFDLVVPSGSILTPNNVVFGSGGTGGTLYGSTGNVSASGSLNMSGTATIGGALTANAGLNVNGGSATIANLTPYGIVQNSSGGVLSTITPGTAGNVLTSTGPTWASSSSINIPGTIQGTNITASGNVAGNTGSFSGTLTTNGVSNAGNVATSTLGVSGGATFNGSTTVNNTLSVNSLSSSGPISGTSGSFSSNVSVTGNVTSTNSYLSTSQGSNAGTVYFGTSGVDSIDYGVTSGGTYTLKGIGAGVLTSNSSGTLTPVAPSTSGNYLISNGSVWQSTTPSHSLATNGYTTLPGGIIMEWGLVGPYASEGGQGVTFPLAFPHAVFNLETTIDMANTSNPAGVDQGCQIQSPGTSGMTVYMQQYGGGSYTWAQYCYWKAIGW